MSVTGGDGGIPAAGDGGPAVAEAKLPEARAASSGLRLRRFWWLWIRLDKRNTMVVLDSRDSSRLESYGRFTKTAET